MKKFLMALALVAVLATVCTPAAFAAEKNEETTVSTWDFFPDESVESHNSSK